MREPRDAQVVVVGGGPAGLAAARELTAAGADTLLLDERPRLAAGAGRTCCGVAVWDIAPGEVWGERDGACFAVRAERILLATGALTRSLPFPGWTLPGVVTPAAAQALVAEGTSPGERAVVAGTGPLLLEAATALRAAGVEVRVLLEANPLRNLLRAAPAVRHLSRLLAAGVRVRFGRTVLAAHGDGRVERVVIGRVDAAGLPRGGEREVAADLLCVGFGLQPATELAARLGCALDYREARGGWFPAHDADLATSVPGVFVAGAAAGACGAEVAVVEGALAGRAIAASLGLHAPDRAGLRAARARERGASDRLLAAFPVPEGLHRLAQPSTVVCRCEAVTMAEVADASRVFGRDVRSVKLGTRAGMGPCQGRECHRIVGELLLSRLGGAERPVPPLSVQAPVRPVTVATFLARGR